MTSYVFKDGKLDMEKLDEICERPLTYCCLNKQLQTQRITIMIFSSIDHCGCSLSDAAESHCLLWLFELSM